MRRAALIHLGLIATLLAPGCYDQPSPPGQDTEAATDDTGTDGTVTTTDTSPTTTSAMTASTTDTTTASTTASTTDATTDPTETADSSTTDPTDPTDTTDDGSTGIPVAACGDGNADPGEYCPPDAPEIFNVGNGASDIVIADIDGGGQDLATLNISASTVSILRGDGVGGFADAESHTVSDNSCRIQAIDGEGDGDIDLVIAGEMMVSLVNDGDGGFGRNDSDVVPFGGCQDHNDLGVLNNNGGPIDVVYSGAYNNTYAPGTNPGAGWAFVNPVGIGGVTEGASGVTVTEFTTDPDNLPDVIVLNQYYSDGELFRGDGQGGFVDAGMYAACVGLGLGARFATTGDIDSDGEIDIVTTCMEGNFTIALGNANGTFDAPVETVYAGAHRPFVADVNLDEYPDVLVSSTALDRINVYLNDGAGGLSEPIQLDVGGAARSVDVGDLDDDGAADIVAAYTDPQGGRVAVFFGQP